MTIAAPLAASQTNLSNGGRLVSVDGRTLPLTASALRADASAGIARVTLEQRFENPYDEPLAVTYSLPLPLEGAVSGFAFQIGDRRIVGEVDRRAAARERFEEALAEGRTAALLEQDRSTLFTQEVGNVPPHTSIVAEITIDQRLIWIDGGAWEWRFPTVVAPRYLGAPGRVPDAARVSQDVADGPLPVRMSLTLGIRDRLPLGARAESPSHSIHGAALPGRLEITLAEDGGARLDRDVVVRWAVAAPEVGLSVNVARKAGAEAAYGLVTLVPPRAEARPRAVRRDLIVLLDTSGSMSGEPLDQATAARVGAGRLAGRGGSARADRVLEPGAPLALGPRAGHREAQAGRHRLAQEAARQRLDRDARGDLRGAPAAARRVAASGRPGHRRPDRLRERGRADHLREAAGGLAPAHGGRRLGREPVADRTRRARRPRRRGRGGPGRGPRARHRAPDGAHERAAGGRPRARRRRPGRGRLGQAARPVRGRAGAAVCEAAPAGRHAGARRPHGRRGLEPAPRAARDRRRHRQPRGHDAVRARGRRGRRDASGGRRTGGRDRPRVEALGLEFQIATRLTSWIAVTEEATVDPGAPTRKQRMPHELPYGMSIEGLGLRPVMAAPMGMPTQTMAGMAGPAQAAMDTGSFAAYGAPPAPGGMGSGGRAKTTMVLGAPPARPATPAPAPPPEPTKKEKSLSRRLFGAIFESKDADDVAESPAADRKHAEKADAPRRTLTGRITVSRGLSLILEALIEGLELDCVGGRRGRARPWRTAASSSRRSWPARRARVRSLPGRRSVWPSSLGSRSAPRSAPSPSTAAP